MGIFICQEACHSDLPVRFNYSFRFSTFIDHVFCYTLNVKKRYIVYLVLIFVILNILYNSKVYVAIEIVGFWESD